ncbi:MAG: putative DNA binding domain-containing protein [Clostridia bacterium]|nr:putative DNA binding domain-containing protein [Clostridia bacterium]
MPFSSETEELEFKKSSGERDEAVKSLSAMLNKHGHGVVYMGVSPDGTVLGQQISTATMNKVSRDITDNIKPQVIPEISSQYIDGKNVLRIEVKGTDFPYSAFGKYYIRSGDEDKEMSPAYLRKAMQFSSSHLLVTTESSIQDLSFSQLKRLYTERGIHISEDNFEKNAYLLTSEGKFNLMAYILADSNAYSIGVARFKGTDRKSMDIRKEFGYKCLLVTMSQVLDYVGALNETKVKISGAQREEETLFSIDAFREAWFNACLHTCWIKEVPPAIAMFDDRIEIKSFGGLAPDFSVEDFFSRMSRPINLELQMIMIQLGFIEQSAHGVEVIESLYGRDAFKIDENSVTVTIPFTHKFGYADRNESNTEEPSSTKTAPEIKRSIPLTEKILNLIKADPNITVVQMSKSTGVTTVAVSNALSKLKESGSIAREGSKRSGKWVVLQ